MRFFFACFKAGGLFVLLAGLGVCVRGLAYRDPYEVVLAGLSLALWLALFLVGLFGAKRLETLAPGWLSPVPLAAGGGGGALHTVTGLDAKVPYFFRLHFTVRGNFSSGSGSRFFVSSEVTGGAPETGLLLGFPMSGVFQGRGACRLRDVFGFFSFPCGPVLHRSLCVQPAPHHKRPALRIDPFSGSEDRQSRSQTDEERYYMREYTPGDRFRDINWKSSERLATLITRISPHTQEKTKMIYLAFRNYGPGRGLLASWLLDRAKARLAVFLRTLKEEHPEFIFHVSTAAEERTLQSMEEIEAFLDELAAVGFQPAAGLPAQGADRAELYLFSTSFDTALAPLLATRGENLSHLFITVPGRRGGGEKAVFRARSIFTEGFFPVSGLFPLRQGAGRGAGGEGFSVPVPRKGSVEVTYAELRL
ncbi:MAG: DUF58 domain-containing protein [Spirochaetia bacterium]|jgi:uncharacterized protein (DUF58 family)|nr:DUF58 domain-containing protein [Spirochaetia bacterium]